MDTKPQAVAFNALLSGVAALQKGFERIGHSYDDFRLMIPSTLGERIERELQSMDVGDWQPFCSGIELFADGHLKQLVVCESIWVGWKTGPIRKRKRKHHDKPHRKATDGPEGRRSDA